MPKKEIKRVRDRVWRCFSGWEESADKNKWPGVCLGDFKVCHKKVLCVQTVLWVLQLKGLASGRRCGPRICHGCTQIYCLVGCDKTSGFK